MSLLQMKIKRVHFDSILKGEKKIEYREVKPYWTQRLEGQDVSMLRLTAGYRRDAPSLIVGVRGVKKIPAPPSIKNLGKEVYAISLGQADLV